MNEEIILEKRLDFLRGKHRELEGMLADMSLDEFTKMRLKKEKLSLRDKAKKQRKACLETAAPAAS